MTCGVYIARNRAGDVLYVGMSKNVEQRIGPNHDKWPILRGAEIEVVACPEERLRVKERDLIDQLKPAYNGIKLFAGDNFIMLRPKPLVITDDRKGIHRLNRDAGKFGRAIGLPASIIKEF